MSYPVPIIAESIERDVAEAEADAAIALVAGQHYEFVSSSACWIKQGAAFLITCVTKANLAEGDALTITIDGLAKIFEFDKAPDGIVAGRVLVDVSADTTAAQVAARLRTAIIASFPATGLTVTDNADGTLTVIQIGAQVAMAEAVANAGFLAAASALLAATAGSGSMYVPAGRVVMLAGKHGQTLSIIRDAADGKSSITRLRFAR